MDFDAVVETLRGWAGREVVVVLEPDHSVMEGPLREIDPGGVDGAMFTVSATGVAVAVALFRDAFVAAGVDEAGTLRVRQGRVEILVTPQAGTAAPTPGR
jgi:hypothetical protein